MTPTDPHPAAAADPARGARPARRAARDHRAARVERRLAVPVLAAAAVSVPAVFLTAAGSGPTALVGTALNWMSVSVLTAESVLLFVLTGERLHWLWRHRWTLGITALAVPAVIFAVAPVQALRLLLWSVHAVGALRILRANRIVKAGRVLARRIGGRGPWRHVPVLAGSVAAGGFVIVILSDPTSTTRRMLADLGRLPTAPGLLAGAAVAATALLVAGLVVVRLRRRRRGPAGRARSAAGRSRGPTDTAGPPADPDR